MTPQTIPQLDPKDLEGKTWKEVEKVLEEFKEKLDGDNLEDVRGLDIVIRKKILQRFRREVLYGEEFISYFGAILTAPFSERLSLENRKAQRVYRRINIYFQNYIKRCDEVLDRKWGTYCLEVGNR